MDQLPLNHLGDSNMDSSIVNLREHMLAKVAVEMDTLATARLHEVLRTCAQATAEGALRTSDRVSIASAVASAIGPGWSLRYNR
jgi:hypothetical protein